MKTKLSPFLIGTFVLGGGLLIVVALLSFRSLHLFSKPGGFIAYFNESVQGLDVGSPVKLRGVRVGHVATIRVHYDSNTGLSRVAVIAELDESGLTDPAGEEIRISDRATLERLIDRGLRARMDLVGITGLQFVELEFMDPKENPAVSREDASGYPQVPTVRSGLSELVSNLSRVAGNLNKVDFAGLSRELQSLLATVNRRVNDVDLQRMVAKVTAAAESIESLAGSEAAKVAFANLNRTATEVQGVAARMDAQIEPVTAELVRTLRSFRDAAEGVQRLVGSQSGLGEEAVRTLQQVGEMAASLQRLADYLERNPNALVTGKRVPVAK